VSEWETIRDSINISAKESLGYYELKECMPWFDEGCSKLLDQRNPIVATKETSQIAVITGSKQNIWG
jgi:hypothetical protein